MIQNNNKINAQNGNAIFMILIAVALFAALGYAFSNTSRSSSNFITDEQAKAYASQIIAYGNEVKSALKRLQLRGCSDTEISFENAVVIGYTNPNAPNDKSCHIFDIAGGGLQWVTPTQSMLVTDNSSHNAYGEYYFANTIQVAGVGTSCSTGDCTELTMHIPHIKKSICDEINSVQNINTVNESVTNFSYQDAKKFIGVYDFNASSDTSTIGDGTSANELPSNTKRGCIYRNGLASQGYPYTYFQVLIAR